MIVDTTEEKYGRVTEDYKNYNQLTACNESEIVISSGCSHAEYDFNLSSVFPSDDWEALSSTSELLRYKYILYNTKYEATPILKGSLSA